MARSPFVPVEEKAAQQAEAPAEDQGGQQRLVMDPAAAAVLLVHSQVRRIKREDEEVREERLLRLRLLDTRPASAAGGVPWRATPRSLSPLRRAGSASAAIPVGE